MEQVKQWAEQKGYQYSENGKEVSVRSPEVSCYLKDEDGVLRLTIYVAHAVFPVWPQDIDHAIREMYRSINPWGYQVEFGGRK